MFGKAKDKPSENDRVPSPVKQLQRTPAAPAEEAVRSVEEICSISSGMTIVGKVTGKGTVRVSGRIEGDVQASTVLINDGGQVEGDIVAEELTVGGRVKGTIRAHRVKLNGSAVVEGDIFHRSLSVEANACFEGSSRREGETVIDSPRAVLTQPAVQVDIGNVAAIEGNGKLTPPSRTTGMLRPDCADK